MSSMKSVQYICYDAYIMMQITVFGASGKVGRLVVAELLTRGYTVVAFVHSQSLSAQDFATKSPLKDQTTKDIASRLQTVQGDIYDQAAVERALSGSQAVISTLSSWGSQRKDILSVAMRAIVPAMERQQIRRIISLTGHDARTMGDDVSLLHRISHSILGIIAGKVLHDGEIHIDLLRQSQLDWTVIRSPIMTAVDSRQYRLTNQRPAPWATITRQAVAQTMVNQLDDRSYNQKSPYII